MIQALRHATRRTKEQAITKRRIATLAVLLAVLPLTVVACAQTTDNGTPVGKPALDFSLRTVDGKYVKLSDQKGQVVVVDFWATWCPPCRASLPHTQKMSDDKDLARRGLVVWAVNDQEDAATINNFLITNNYTFTVPMDPDGATLQAYQVSGIPTLVIVGRDGVVQNAFTGFGDTTAAEVDQAVDKALAAPKPN